MDRRGREGNGRKRGTGRGQENQEEGQQKLVEEGRGKVEGGREGRSVWGDSVRGK